MNVITTFALAISLSSPALLAAAELNHETDYAVNTAAKAMEFANRGQCPKAMALIAMNLRDQRWRSLPESRKGEILTAWAFCATKIAKVSLRP